jgi:hypothetical protein
LEASKRPSRKTCSSTRRIPLVSLARPSHSHHRSPSKSRFECGAHTRLRRLTRTLLRCVLSGIQPILVL